MAAFAAEPIIEPLSLAQTIRVVFIRLSQREIDLRGSARDPVRHQRNLVQCGSDGRIEPQLALLPFASSQGHDADQQYDHPHGDIHYAERTILKAPPGSYRVPASLTGLTLSANMLLSAALTAAT